MVAYECLNTYGRDQRFLDVRDSSHFLPMWPLLARTKDPWVKGPDDTAAAWVHCVCVCVCDVGVHVHGHSQHRVLWWRWRRSCFHAQQSAKIMISKMWRYTVGRLLVQDLERLSLSKRTPLKTYRPLQILDYYYYILVAPHPFSIILTSGALCLLLTLYAEQTHVHIGMLANHIASALEWFET